MSVVLRYIAPPLALLALIAWLWVGWTRADNRVESLTLEVQVQTARADMAERREAAMKVAEVERAMDDTKLDQMKDDLTNAIDRAPAPADAGVALACERLRRAGNVATPEYKRVCGGR